MTAPQFVGARWHKSTVSGDTGCVEVAFANQAVGVRDSKLGDDSPVLVFTQHEWSVFLQGAGNGEFNLPSA